MGLHIENAGRESRHHADEVAVGRSGQVDQPSRVEALQEGTPSWLPAVAWSAGSGPAAAMRMAAVHVPAAGSRTKSAAARRNVAASTGSAAVLRASAVEPSGRTSESCRLVAAHSCFSAGPRGDAGVPVRPV